MRPVVTYDEALSFLYSFIDYESNSEWKYNTEEFDLDRFREFLHALGNPHERGRFVHVAGTNGKGSVSAMISSALSEAGLKTGLYTSPHLVTYRERIQINGTNISKDDVLSTVNIVKEKSSGFPGLTFFELWTALAFYYFAEKNCDVTVTEVGLGGRLDATNVITPDVSVITSVSVDHSGKLGNTPELIAREKAGIIKPGVTVVCAPQSKEVTDVIFKAAYDNAADVVVTSRDTRYAIVNEGICYSGIKWRADSVPVPLNGAMQSENAAVALTVLEILGDKGYPVDVTTAVDGIGKVEWPGRLQQVADNPDVIVDGACNVAAMQAVIDYCVTRAGSRRIVAVIGMCKDKDVRDVLAVLGGGAPYFVLTRVINPRAIDPAELAALSPRTVKTEVHEKPVDALEHARTRAGKDGLVIVAGSLYLVGEVLEYYGIGEKD